MNDLKSACDDVIANSDYLVVAALKGIVAPLLAPGGDASAADVAGALAAGKRAVCHTGT